MKGMVKRKNNLGIPPSQESECLLVFEEIFQADLVVHDGLQTLDALQLHPLPLPVGKAAKLGISCYNLKLDEFHNMQP